MPLEMNVNTEFSNLGWEVLESFVQKGFIAQMDLFLARALLKGSFIASQNCAALICHLAASTRFGHLCILVSKHSVIPHPKEVWQEKEGSYNFENGEFEIFFAMIQQGINELPKRLVTYLADDDSHTVSLKTPICVMGERVYLQRYWLYETSFIDRCKFLLSQTVKVTIDSDLLKNKISQLIENKSLLQSQALAITNACDNPLTVISGGPGTGKTYTAGHLIRILWDSLTDSQKLNFSIALAAPTGKAAANLQKSLATAAKDVPLLSSLQAKTLHRLLDINSSKKSFKCEKQLFEDLVIIDESSMIDMQMMAALFSSIKPGSRLILLGDSCQLPAVNAGAPFTDLIAISNDTKNTIVNELKTCLRVELKSIVDFAAAVNNGDASLTKAMLKESKKESGLQKLDIDIESNSKKFVKNVFCNSVCNNYYFAENLLAFPEKLFQKANSFRILSPLKNGSFGSIEINKMLLKEVKKLYSSGGNFIAPILILKNDYTLNFFNGEVGLLVRPNFHMGMDDFEFSRDDYTLFLGNEGNVRKTPALLMPMFEYAYCMTVHKSQGSEFDRVVLVLPGGSQRFGREVLYTGITRAKKSLSLLSSNSILYSTVQQKSYRLSGFYKRLQIEN